MCNECMRVSLKFSLTQTTDPHEAATTQGGRNVNTKETEHAAGVDYNLKRAMTADKRESAALYASIAQAHALMLIAERLHEIDVTFTYMCEIAER